MYIINCDFSVCCYIIVSYDNLHSVCNCTYIILAINMKSIHHLCDIYDCLHCTDINKLCCR